MEEDGCGSSGYEGGYFDDKDGIFCFEGGFEVRRVWMVSEASEAATETAKGKEHLRTEQRASSGRCR
jgi:hypothetical protein